jgi:superfamily I DNA/RNA helicase
MKRELILGGPGAGKTTRLLSIVDQELGILPSYQIAFVSFTNKAVNEATDRATLKFEVKRERLPFFRTLHSICFRQLGINYNRILKRSHFREIGKILGIEITGKTLIDDLDTSMRRGDKMLFLSDLSRSTKTDLEETWHRYGNDWDILWPELLRFSETLKRYKREKNMIDFTDMLDLFIKEGSPIPVEVAVIDEAQDLTPLQWDAVDVAFKRCARQYIAGDDDQAIYEWSGADVHRFLNLGEDRREILPKSYRLPKEIFKLSKKLAKRISKRYEKEWDSRDELGTVQRITSLEDLDLSLKGSWLLLARNICHFSYLKEECYQQGVPFTVRGEVSSVDPEDVRAIKAYERLRKGWTISGSEAVLVADRLGIKKQIEENCEYRLSGLVSSDPGIWHDAMAGLAIGTRTYYVTILRNGGHLTDQPRIQINTIHGVKGGEADNVALMTDMTKGTEDNLEKNPDAETRVFYVGITRARKNLFIILPQTQRGFKLP